MKKNIYLLLLFLSTTSLFSMNIDRVILSSDTGSYYLDYWPIVGKAWKQMGVKPTLALIGNEHVQVDETIGDVIRFPLIPEIPMSYYAQIIRLFIPMYYEDDVSIIADIDMLPISKEFLIDSIKDIADDKFVVYNDLTYKGKDIIFPEIYSSNSLTIFPICYCAAKGKTFKEVFQINDTNDISKFLIHWFNFSLNLGHQIAKDYPDKTKAKEVIQKIVWRSDERLLVAYLQAWKDYSSRCIKLGNAFGNHFIDRCNWQYTPQLLNKGFYRDSHLPRPYSEPENKKLIDQLLKDLGWENLIPTNP